MVATEVLHEERWDLSGDERNLEEFASNWSWLIPPLGIVWYLGLAVATSALLTSSQPVAAGIPIMLGLFGWVNGSFETYEYMVDIRRMHGRTAIILGWLFALVCGLSPLGFVLLPNAHRVAVKHGL